MKGERKDEGDGVVTCVPCAALRTASRPHSRRKDRKVTSVVLVVGFVVDARWLVILVVLGGGRGSDMMLSRSSFYCDS